jgi:cysteine-rich repeat protein
MIWLRLLAVAAVCGVLHGCSVDTGGLPFDDGDGGNGTIDAAAPDGPEIDATVDAAVIDAALPDAPLLDGPLPDAPPDTCGDLVLDAGEQCDDGNKLGGDGCSDTCQIETGECPAGVEMASIPIGQTMSGTNVGEASLMQSDFGQCGGSSAGEDVWVLSLPVLADVTVTTDLPGTTFRTSLYVRASCTGPTLECASAGPLGDSVKLANLQPGLYYIVVDGFSGAMGNYEVRVDILPIVPEGADCDPSGQTNRCEDGTVCSSSGGPGHTCQAEQVLCAANATPLALDMLVAAGGTTQGASTYTPGCLGGGAPTGGEVFYGVSVPSGGGTRDLVVEVEGAGAFNPLVSIDATCGDPASRLACVNSSATPDRDEVAVVGNVQAGSYYPVVDGVGGQNGDYTISAWLRPVVGNLAACDRALRTTRCAQGVCIDSALDANVDPSCLTGVDEVMDSGNNNTACTAFDGPRSGDFVYRGSMSNGDIDVIKLTPASDTRVVISVYTGEGACALDLAVTIARVNCQAPMPMPQIDHTDDDAGLGACPFLDTGPNGLQGGQDYYLGVVRAANFGTGNYVMVVDFIP